MDIEHSITTIEALEAAVGRPTQINVDKVLDRLDDHMVAIIGASPYLLMATSDLAGRMDVSPRGDPVGWVSVVDEQTILLPDRPGNRRADSLHNLIENPRVGLIFVVPRFDETLRISGSATITRDAALLEPCAANGRVPELGIVVHIEECFIQCGRASRRAGLWEPQRWPAVDSLPSMAEMLKEQAKTAVPIDALEERVAAAYTPEGLYQPTVSSDIPPGTVRRPDTVQ